MFINSKILPAVFSSLAALVLYANCATAAETNVRIGIIPSAKEVLISTSVQTPIALKKNNPGAETVYQMQPLVPLYLRIDNGNLCLYDQEKLLGQYNGTLIMKPDAKSSTVPLVYAAKHWYRGYIEAFVGSDGNITVVNTLPMEKYLYGVVPGEMPYTWPIEALKAQAVAARTYSFASLGGYSKQGFDMKATAESQMYLGVEGEKPSTNKAVDETKGKTITYNGKLITAYYHSTSGGITENGWDSWADLPYLKAVADYDQKSPKYLWYKNILASEIKEDLSKKNINVGDIVNITVNKRSQTGRAKDVQITGTAGTQIIDAYKFRGMTGINSTFFNVGIVDTVMGSSPNPLPQTFQFAGRGWGHGLGMCQWGACGMAANGKNYEQILTYYYSGTKVVSN